MADRPPPRYVEPRPVSVRDVTPGKLAGVDRDLIEQVVHAFYAEIREDEVLGPIFNGRIEAARWPVHLATMVEFWSSVLLLTGSYKGKPVPAHLPLKLTDPHYIRWLGLFERVTKRLCSVEGAALFMERAGRIADSLRMSSAMLSPEGQLRDGFPQLVPPLARGEAS
jgi:hemoglobin